MPTDQSNSAVLSAEGAFISSLGAGREAFHSEVTEFALRINERHPTDFIRHFTVANIMKALENRPTERARIVTEATGTSDKVANRLSPLASGEMLQIALDEAVSTPAEIVRLFQPDDRVRYLDRKALWKFVMEGEPWKAKPSGKEAFERAKLFIAYILNRALGNLLVTHEELVSALTVQKLASALPKDQLGAIIESALSRRDKFTQEHLLQVTPVDFLVQYIPLDYIWEKSIVPLIASRHGYSDDGAPIPLGSTEEGGGWGSIMPKPERSISVPPADNADAPLVDEDELVTEDDIVDSAHTEPDVPKISAEGGGKKRR